MILITKRINKSKKKYSIQFSTIEDPFFPQIDLFISVKFTSFQATPINKKKTGSFIICSSHFDLYYYLFSTLRLILMRKRKLVQVKLKRNFHLGLWELFLIVFRIFLEWFYFSIHLICNIYLQLIFFPTIFLFFFLGKIEKRLVIYENDNKKFEDNFLRFCFFFRDLWKRGASNSWIIQIELWNIVPRIK